MKKTTLSLFFFSCLWGLALPAFAVNKANVSFKNAYLVQMETMSGQSIKGHLLSINDSELVLLEKGQAEAKVYSFESIKTLRIHRKGSLWGSLLVGGLVSGTAATLVARASLGMAEVTTQGLIWTIGGIAVLGALFLGGLFHLLGKKRYKINGKRHRFAKFKKKLLKSLS
ncbi:MAG: hypothetical protein AAF985_01725 [Bacteroidota bacterium]